MLVARTQIAGVEVTVFRVHRFAGFAGKPFVVLLPYTWIVDGGLERRPTRFVSVESALQVAQRKLERCRRRAPAKFWPIHEEP